MTLPTSCAPATVTLNGESASFTPTGCDQVPFNPTVEAALETTQRAVPSGATITLKLPDGDSHVRRTDIVLPVGTTLSPGVANGLVACTQAQFDATDCPAASQVGTVSFATPLLPTLAGKVFFGDNFRLYIVVAGSGVLVKLAGDVRLDPATGQITTVFDNLPQVPFTTFAFSFQGGPRAVLSNPTTCGEKTLTRDRSPRGAAPRRRPRPPRSRSTRAAPRPPSRPRCGSRRDSTAAGRPAGAVTMEITRPDGAPDITRVTTALPPGLAGSLKGVPVCAEAQADAGTCPEDTRVGRVSALAGAGGAPVALAGTVSLTGPFDGGLAGLAIAIPGRVGPVDLGTVVVRASIVLRPDGGLSCQDTRRCRRWSAASRSRSASSRSRSTARASSSTRRAARRRPWRAVLEGADGGTATVTAPYQATDCAGLPFAPKLEATIGARGRTARRRVPAAEGRDHRPRRPGRRRRSPTSRCRPRSAPTWRGSSKACPPGAATCPASARIGSAVATTPLLAAPLTSPVTLAVPAAGELPGLALQLTGPVSLPLFGKVDVVPRRRPDPQLVRRASPTSRSSASSSSFTTASPLKLKRDVCHGARQTRHRQAHRPQRQGREPARAAEGRRLPAGRHAQAPADQGQARPRRRRDPHRQARAASA